MLPSLLKSLLTRSVVNRNSLKVVFGKLANVSTWMLSTSVLKLVVTSLKKSLDEPIPFGYLPFLIRPTVVLNLLANVLLKASSYPGQMVIAGNVASLVLKNATISVNILDNKLLVLPSHLEFHSGIKAGYFLNALDGRVSEAHQTDKKEDIELEF